MNGAGTLGLTAMIAAYNEGEEWLEQLKEYLDGNFAYIDAFLKEHLPKAHMVPSEGTYLAWIDFNGYVDGDAEKLERSCRKRPGWLWMRAISSAMPEEALSGSISLRPEAWWRTAWTGSSRRLKKKS